MGVLLQVLLGMARAVNKNLPTRVCYMVYIGCKPTFLLVSSHMAGGTLVPLGGCATSRPLGSGICEASEPGILKTQGVGETGVVAAVVR